MEPSVTTMLIPGMYGGFQRLPSSQDRHPAFNQLPALLRQHGKGVCGFNIVPAYIKNILNLFAGVQHDNALGQDTVLNYKTRYTVVCNTPLLLHLH